MTAIHPARTINPYRLQRRALWHNRVQQWRQVPVETAFHTAAWIGLGILFIALASLAGRSTVLDLLRAAMLGHPAPWLLGASALMAMHAASRLRRWDRQARSDWYFAQPVEAAVRQVERLRMLVLALLPYTLAGAVLLLAMRMPAMGWAGLALAVMLAALFALLWTRRQRHANSQQRDDSTRPRWHDAGRGTLWRWQKIEASAGYSPRVLARGGWILLLIPVGASAIAAGISTVVGLGIAAGISAWRRSLDVLFQAQTLLQMQPLRLRFWLGGAVFPALLAGFAAITLAAGFSALGAARVAPWIGLAVVALALLQIACVLAERRRPRRVALVGALHLALLGATSQLAAPLLPVVWLGQCLWLLRRAARP